MLRKIFNFFISFFNEIYIFESKCNKKNIRFENYFLKKYKVLSQIQDNKIIHHLKKDEKYLRFKKKQVLIVLFYKKKSVCSGWMNKGSNWLITEINKKINITNTIVLYDFFTFQNLRKKGYYIKILKLIKNIKTNKTFIIYSLKSNKKSCKGILKANFIFKSKMKRLF